MNFWDYLGILGYNEYLSLEDHDRGPPPLGFHVARRLYDDELHLVLVGAVERMRDQLRHLAVGTPTHLHAVHLQNHVTHLKPARVERCSCVLQEREGFS